MNVSESQCLSPPAHAAQSKSPPDYTANLAGFLNEPVIQAVVVRMLTEADYPLVLRDFVSTGGLRVTSANRVLLRLHDRGLVSRYKLPMRRHYYCHKRKACVPGATVRWVFAYTWTGD